MNPRLPTYLKLLRRRHGLSQKELAYLCGMESGTQISRYERSIRDPSLGTLLALLIIFGTTPPELFPGLQSEIHRMVIERAEELYAELQGNAKKVTSIKLDLLEQIIKGSQIPPNHPPL